MKSKAFELRDRGTFVPAVAIKLDAANEAEAYLLRRSGFAEGESYILLGALDGGLFHYDKYDCGQNGTRFTAHDYIRDNFDDLEPGQVICTEFIRGERTTPKTSERLE